MIKEMIKNHQSGKLGGDKYVLQLKNAGLLMIYNPGYTLPADVKKAGDAAIEGIKSGSITVNP